MSPDGLEAQVRELSKQIGYFSEEVTLLVKERDEARAEVKALRAERALLREATLERIFRDHAELFTCLAKPVETPEDLGIPFGALRIDK